MIDVITTKVASQASSINIFHRISINSIFKDLSKIIRSAPISSPIIKLWAHPRDPFIKLNFDGFSLGNPIPPSIGCLIKYCLLACLKAFVGPIGTGTLSLQKFMP